MNKIYRTVIIDDEESAIDNLCLALKPYGQIVVEGVAHNGAAGLKLIEKVRPDLVFQDVELPDMLGMELVTRARKKLGVNMEVVFYTAYNKYMIDAFRAYAFDFLLKPVDSQELELVIRRLEERGKEVEAVKVQLPVPTAEKPFMMVTPTGDLRFLHASEIGYFRYLSGRKLWEVALSDGTFLPLKRNTTAEQLCIYDKSFVQVHQSYIVNMNYLVMVQDNRCIMYPPFDGCDELLVFKKYRKEMMDRFYQL